MGSRPPLCAVREMPPRGVGGDPGRGRGGGPGRDETLASPGRGGRQGGVGQVAVAARAGAPAATESAERAPHLQVCGWRCAGRKVCKWRDRRSRAARGDLRRGSPSRVPARPRPRLQPWAPSPASSELARSPRTAEAGRGECEEAPVRPALDPGRGWAGARAEPALLTGRSRC